MQVKLNPINNARISFPGFQEIADFTFTGAQSSLAVPVNGDTDLEYKIMIFYNDTAQDMYMRLNNDSGANYGSQLLRNNNGTITASRSTADSSFAFTLATSTNASLAQIDLLTPAGFVKTMSYQSDVQSSLLIDLNGFVYNSTSNITSLNFGTNASFFTAGTRIAVYARRS